MRRASELAGPSKSTAENYRAVVDADLEGIVAKRLADAYRPNLTRWQNYSQRHGRAEWIGERRVQGGKR